MSDDVTARLALPLLDSGQAQKEMTHNEALVLLDLLVQPVVVAGGLNVPPASPAIGEAWVVGAAPTGVWAGKALTVAGWTAGGWRFVAPRAGMSLWSLADSVWLSFDGTGWHAGDLRGGRVLIGGVQVVGSRAAAIADASGGTTIDVQARAAIASILAALRAHGLVSP